MDVVYWQWIVFGIFLILFELMIPSFTAMWFGIAAVIVGVALWFLPDLAGSLQVLIWTILSGALTYAWFRVFKPKKRHHPVSKKEVEGELGLVASLASSTRPGIVRFSTPLLGEDEWPYQCDQKLVVGQQVKVVDAQEDVLIVIARDSV